MIRAAESLVTIDDEFWSRYRSLVASEVLPYQWRALNDELPGLPPSHAVANLRIAAGEAEGDFYGMVFQDSDVAKWIEAACYSLAYHPDPVLAEQVEELVALFARAQQEDGYLNSFYTVAEPPENRWNNLRDCHELYCAGHIIEAAVAHHGLTGRRTFLDVAIRYADLIDATFGPRPGQLRGYPGHPEIELALVRLADTTGESRYLELARYFLLERGTEPHYFDEEAERRRRMDPAPKPFTAINPADVGPDQLNYGVGHAFQQAHRPFLDQEAATGHAVRAMYLYSAATDLCLRGDEPAIRTTVDRLWDDVVNHKMYVTAGIGSQVPGESFTTPYDLPNETMYCETCATVGLVMWSRRMLGLRLDSVYSDVLERALYNGSISGISLDGKAYFYINTLQYNAAMDGRVMGWEISRPSNERQNWFNCSCCPTNLARMIGSLETTVYSASAGLAAVHLYIGSTADLDLGGRRLRLRQHADVIREGRARIEVEAVDGDEAITLALRLPGWSRSTSVTVNGEPVDASGDRDGYRHVHRVWRTGDVVELELDMAVHAVRSNPRVRDNVGRVAWQRGPLVYCFEQCDNGPDLAGLRLPAVDQVEARWEPELLGGVVTLNGRGERLSDEGWSGTLYRSDDEPEWVAQDVRAVPYYAWANRDKGDMQVWMLG